MEEFGGPRFESIGNAIRKKRSQISRRPRPESLKFSESLARSPLSSTPPSDDVSKNSSDEITGGDTNSRRKLFNLNQCALRDTTSRAGEYLHKKIKKDGSSYGYGDLEDSVDKGGSGLNNRQCSEGVFAPANWKSTNKTKGSFELQSTTADIHGGRNGESERSWHSRVNGHGVGNDTNLKKVKLKVGGVTRTIQAKSNSHGASGSGSSTKDSRTSDAPRSQLKMILQDNSDDDDPPPLVKKSFIQGIPWKDFSGGSSDLGMGKMPEKNASANRGEKSEPVRKSKRMTKRRVLDGEFDEEDEDDEIRYLEKLKISKVAAGSKDFEEESSKKQQRIARVSKSVKHGEISEDFVSSRSSKDGKKKTQSERRSEDTDYEEEEELMSDGEPGGKKKKKPRNDSIELTIENKRELGLTTRQRALFSGKDASSVSGTSLVEFPNGLPPAPSRKQKEKLSEVEQQLKKAEAAQRRRMQVEKAARESEAEAIRKILGQDSSRKKREDKIKKRQEEIAQEKAANALVLASNTIRLVMGPTGTVVTFSKDMGLPSIFNPKPHSYPPPREKCAGPSCTNPYKYRDSKSKLPLCSLHCYKAINEKMQAETTS
ncbi:INO80 complex subunit B like [Actinidia chinensis var. chinensis]|uniref:INO80 complex subunit B like n=1 Tax=Actinidia chinensis var. chinensis TaxID=1590841 RepID=A0A2R6P5L5_ACTCC|nr:INO80 complex subunit B like [Actinidia chinensis var. chinensis]